VYKKIAVIDEEVLILEMVQNYLEKNGYKCEVFSNAQQALDAVDTTFDVIFVEVLMPQISGITLSKMLVKKFPKIKVVLMSTLYSCEKLGHLKGNYFFDNEHVKLSKPFQSLRTLIDTIESF
jgi:two-component system response regulator YesN